MSPEQLIGRGLLGDDLFVAAPNGRRLRAMIAGSGEDLVVLEGGLGVSGLYWGLVHALVAQRVRVVAYERAGFGASTPARGETRDLSRLTDDLSAVVDAFPHRRLVLVGHSWGGPIVRAFAARHIADGRQLSGLVLVDPSDEHAADLYASRWARGANALLNALLVPLTRARLLAPSLKAQLAGLSGDLLHAVLTASSTVDAARAAVEENRHVAEGLLALKAEPLALDAVPLSLISARQDNLLNRRMHERIMRAHRQTVDAHPGARLVAAHRSSHMIPGTEPELVAEEALRLLDDTLTAT